MAVQIIMGGPPVTMIVKLDGIAKNPRFNSDNSTIFTASAISTDPDDEFRGSVHMLQPGTANIRFACDKLDDSAVIQGEPVELTLVEGPAERVVSQQIVQG